MAEIFDCTVENIIFHLQNVLESGEISEKATTKDYLAVREEGGRMVKRTVKNYNLDAIISIGYKVNSIRGTQFRIWATQKLKEYIIKGFVMDDERLENGNVPKGYFQEWEERIRKIRTSERNFYLKVTDVFATSADYNPKADYAKKFFATVQNKFHFAITGLTAIETFFEFSVENYFACFNFSIML
jgi:hypothetical protein